MARFDDRVDCRRNLKSNRIDPYSDNGVRIPYRGTKTVSGNVTLTADDSGKTIIVTAADAVVTLPTAVAGLNYTFILDAAGLSTGTGLSISPASADAIGGNGLTSVDNKDLILAGSGDREGDMVSIFATAVDGLEWVITGVIGTWSKEA